MARSRLDPKGRYWCLCNSCLLQNQGKHPLDIPTLSVRSCQRHGQVTPDFTIYTDRSYIVKPGAVPYPVYPLAPNEDNRAHMESWYQTYLGASLDRRGIASVQPDPCHGEPSAHLEDLAGGHDVDAETLGPSWVDSDQVTRLNSRLPGSDGSRNRQGYDGRAYQPPGDDVPKAVLGKLLVNILMLRARRPG